ncbi:MAG: bifunctional phosphopantothenoylcysteine decarboxylase/phosphopantothenate--cysteine ligase CoaBC [Candidatus Kariarchaeaceae archaeon]|jgi:phosphopantothenoylcysteine decarboxylase/phosphopantothenate--cysteine ligase
MMTNHPSSRIFASKSKILEGKRIVLGITGSVAAFKSPEIARELIRLGAEVIPVMTSAGISMIGVDLMWWATGRKPITVVTGELEHISLAGVMNKPADLMLIAPCTTNTIAKLASGIADTPVTLIASSLNGRGIPIMILGVAHEDLINSLPIQKSLISLKDSGYSIINPIREEGKAKMPDVDEVIFEVLSVLINNTLEGKSVVITGGPTREYIDQVRYITNSSSGITGVELSKEAYFHGADTLLVLGPVSISIPIKIPTEKVETTSEMITEVIKFLNIHNDAIVILSAAMADFTPMQINDGKIKSGQSLKVDLKPTEKLSDLIKQKYPKSKLILFKAEWQVSRDELIKRAKIKLEKCDADLIVANDLSKPNSGFESRVNKVLLIHKDGQIQELEDTKSNLARAILELFR